MLSSSGVEDVIIFRVVNIIILKYWMLSFLNVEDVIIFGVNVIIFEFLDVIIFETRGCYPVSWCKCYHF